MRKVLLGIGSVLGLSSFASAASTATNFSGAITDATTAIDAGLVDLYPLMGTILIVLAAIFVWKKVYSTTSKG